MLRSKKKAYRKHDGRSICGFTMVEIIVALAILSTSMLAVFGTLKMCIVANSSSQRLTESVLLAERLLAETTLEDSITFHTRKGNEGQFSWQIQTAPTGMDNLAAVCITVEWLNQQRPQEYQLYSLVHIPARMEGK
ncbi:MAG: type IV pilus modification PilV family protein [Planctomycetota bacterium]|jgi:prepilin-type N-terminal cleavage/methylation domain-containing protein